VNACVLAVQNTQAAVPHHLGDDLSKRTMRGFVGEEIDGKRVLGADGFSYPVGMDRPLVDAARSPVMVGAAFPKCCCTKNKVCALRSSPVLIAVAPS
jgi:hypothetical protein